MAEVLWVEAVWRVCSCGLSVTVGSEWGLLSLQQRQGQCDSEDSVVSQSAVEASRSRSGWVVPDLGLAHYSMGC